MVTELVSEPSDSPSWREEMGLPMSRGVIVASEIGDVLISVSWDTTAVSREGSAVSAGREEDSTTERGGEGYAEEGVPLTECLTLSMVEARVWSVESQPSNFVSSGLTHQLSVEWVVLVKMPMLVLMVLYDVSMCEKIAGIEVIRV